MHRGARHDVDLVTVKRHLGIGHAHQLRVEQWRQDVAGRGGYCHIEQPCLADETPEPAALVPILDNEVAGWFGYFFCDQRDDLRK